MLPVRSFAQSPAIPPRLRSRHDYLVPKIFNKKLGFRVQGLSGTAVPWDAEFCTGFKRVMGVPGNNHIELWTKVRTTGA